MAGYLRREPGADPESPLCPQTEGRTSVRTDKCYRLSCDICSLGQGWGNRNRNRIRL